MNASNANGASEKQPKPTPICAGYNNWHRKGDEPAILQMWEPP
jgi:hypothetical protein